MIHLTRLMLFALGMLFTVASPGIGQGLSSSPSSEAEPTQLRFVITAQFVPDTRTPLPGSVALLEQFANREALTSVNVSTEGTRGTVTAQFAFSSMDAFRAWAAREDTQALVRSLNQFGQMGTRLHWERAEASVKSAGSSRTRSQ